MRVEVELKAPCKGAESKVKALGGVFVKSEKQVDTYFTHPCRDFRRTDEALRIRRTDRLTITYKGPKRKSKMKMREEVEFPATEDAFKLLKRLGFKKAFTIRKRRRIYKLGRLTLCCDFVEGLGEYVEVESLDPRDKSRILGVFEKLKVKDKATTNSYSDILGI
ncbi:MAG: class IV adenylate cyclase [Candidatus Altiarchaeota archaeon]